MKALFAILTFLSSPSLAVAQVVATSSTPAPIIKKESYVSEIRDFQKQKLKLMGPGVTGGGDFAVAQFYDLAKFLIEEIQFAEDESIDIEKIEAALKTAKIESVTEKLKSETGAEVDSVNDGKSHVLINKTRWENSLVTTRVLIVLRNLLNLTGENKNELELISGILPQISYSSIPEALFFSAPKKPENLTASPTSLKEWKGRWISESLSFSQIGLEEIQTSSCAADTFTQPEIEFRILESKSSELELVIRNLLQNL